MAGGPASRRSTKLAGIIWLNVSLKRLKRSYNRLRLYLVPAEFTSLQVLDMQPEFLYPRRSRFAPNIEKEQYTFEKFRLFPNFCVKLRISILEIPKVFLRLKFSLSLNLTKNQILTKV